MTTTLPPPRSRPVNVRHAGATHGPITRLMSPSDLGEITKPFVFLDLFRNDGTGPGFGDHPHSGIATLTYLIEGRSGWKDTTGAKGVLEAGGVEWMEAGKGVWHGGEKIPGAPTRGFQLWFSLPPERELGASRSEYLPASKLRKTGPAVVLLGRYEGAASPIVSPFNANYLFVALKAGERWRYQPPAGHTVLWAAPAKGEVDASGPLRTGEIAIFKPSEEAVEFRALTDTEFVIGSSAPARHPLVLGHYSVHTSAEALRQGEREITRLGRANGHI